MVSEGGQRVVRPMRYQCRPTGKPAFDTKFPALTTRAATTGEILEGPSSVCRIGIMVADAFYENVERHDQAGQTVQRSVGVQARGMGTMLVACLWSHWKEGG